ncbi:MAG: hypothetical protein ACJ75J_14080 [Cytophagaceae bacterium]
MKEMVLVLSVRDLDSLGSVRCVPRLSAALDGEQIWLRGIRPAEYADLKFRRIPAVNTYSLDDDDYLFAPGETTPVAKLQELTWTSMSDFIPVTLPVSAMPGVQEEKYQVRLIPSEHVERASCLKTDLNTWKTYAATAPEVRLQDLRFAVSEKKQVLIMGWPLPSVPGIEYYGKNDILIPCGYNFEMNMIWDLLPSLLNPAKDMILLIDSHSEWQKIPLDCFVNATRSAVRLTGEVSDE